MTSSTSNVKMGVCQIIYDGVDLGFTQGGVDVTVATQTHDVNIDQFGKTIVNQLIMGRDVKVKVPLAETTIDNLVAIMPGATLVETGGSVATGVITVVTNPAATDTIIVNGATVTFVATVTDPNIQCAIGASAAATALLLVAMLKKSTNMAIAALNYTIVGGVIIVGYGNELTYGTTGQTGVVGNSIALSAGTAGAKVTVVQLTGGADPTSRSISVTTGVSKDLLSFAKELRLHPTALLATDKSQDFVIPLAATGGALAFAYKVDAERIYQVEFTGYPDSTANGKLFTIGV